MAHTPTTPTTEKPFAEAQKKIFDAVIGHTPEGFHPAVDAAHHTAAIELLSGEHGASIITNKELREKTIKALQEGHLDGDTVKFGGIKHILDKKPDLTKTITEVTGKVGNNNMAERGIVAGALSDVVSANGQNAAVKGLLDTAHNPGSIEARIKDAAAAVKATVEEGTLSSEVLNGTKDAYAKAVKTHLGTYATQIADSVVKKDLTWTQRATGSVGAIYKHGVNPVNGKTGIGFVGKAGKGLETAVGAGLIMHGGKNLIVGFTGSTDKETGEQVGPSFTKSLVGLGEMAGGLAAVSHGLTGRVNPLRI